MLNILITFLTFLLIIVSLFMVLVILMQRPNTNAGMGAAFGGGMTESAFGTETSNILTKATRYSAVAFFVLCLSLYLLHISKVSNRGEGEFFLPNITEEAAPTMTAPSAPNETETQPAE
ncbi:MAG: preprotein translocase subunit SecG [Verrucomicrobia bacterium]|nr:preprotein translocase subunit SecG [Verrucomicrobiota bacterium]